MSKIANTEGRFKMTSSALKLMPTRFSDVSEVTRFLNPGEPVYLFSEKVLRNRARTFLRKFPGTVSYAVKANPEERVLKTLWHSGVSNFDVASIEEVRLVSALFPGATMHFNNPIKTPEAIHEAYNEHGVRSFALDEKSELHKIVSQTGGDPDVIHAVRFKLEHACAAYDFGSKFGASTDDAISILNLAGKLGLKTAVTFHPGSQCIDAEMYDHYLNKAAYILGYTGVAPVFVNVGGGFPEYYPGTELPQLDDYFDVIKVACDRYFDKPVDLLCEPGRAMAGSCASLLTQVIHTRPDGRTLYINDGIYGGLQEQTLVKLNLPVRVWRDGELLAGSQSEFTVFGPTCDPCDKLPGSLLLPAGVRAGDFIEFGLLGAYGSTTSTRFNGFSSGSYVDVNEQTAWWEAI